MPASITEGTPAHFTMASQLTVKKTPAPVTWSRRRDARRRQADRDRDRQGEDVDVRHRSDQHRRPREHLRRRHAHDAPHRVRPVEVHHPDLDKSPAASAITDHIPPSDGSASIHDGAVNSPSSKSSRNAFPDGMTGGLGIDEPPAPAVEPAAARAAPTGAAARQRTTGTGWIHRASRRFPDLGSPKPHRRWSSVAIRRYRWTGCARRCRCLRTPHQGRELLLRSRHSQWAFHVVTSSSVLQKETRAVIVNRSMSGGAICVS